MNENDKESHLETVRGAFFLLSNDFHMKQGVSLIALKRAISIREADAKNKSNLLLRLLHRKKIFLGAIIVPLLCGLIFPSSGIDFVAKYAFQGTRCLIPNNYLVWEFTRPLSNCDFCRNVHSALVLPNLTREEFEPYAYSSRPIVVKNAASHWPARQVFSLLFFKTLYDSIGDAYESVEEECQFLHFKSNLASLREVFSMSERRAARMPGEESWYVGWKNCHHHVLEIMKKFYETPHFLPEDVEMPHTNYVFLGYDQGAIMHFLNREPGMRVTCSSLWMMLSEGELDYIPRLMWQGQILGSKTWTVAPTPECDHVCKSFNFPVGAGDIVLLDTRIWYHGTYVDSGQFSLTVTSEYG